MWFLLSRIMLLTVSTFSLGYFMLLCIYDTPLNVFTYIWLGIGVICAAAFFLLIRKPAKRFRTGRKKNDTSLKTVLTRLLPIAAVTGAVIMVICAAAIFEFIVTPPRIADTDDAVWLIVPGAGIRGNGEVSELLESRLAQAARYLTANPLTTVIVSGGQGGLEPVSEAESMAAYLVDAGIPADRIVLEAHSRNTRQNMLLSEAIIEERGSSGDKTVIITSASHLARCMLLASRAGLSNTSGIAVPVPALLVPNVYLRELFSVVKMGLEIALAEPVSGN